MPLLAIIAIVSISIAFYAVSIYNFLQRTKTRITASIQEIGNQLKRQASLIPNLEASVKGYLKHEKSIFKMLTDARKSVEAANKDQSPEKLAKVTNSLQSLLPKLQIVIEDNPELKSDKVVSRLMDELRDTSDKLMYARRTLIDLAADYNVKLVTFPSNIVANLFNFKPEKGLETPTEGEHVSVSSAETKSPQVKLD